MVVSEVGVFEEVELDSELKDDLVFEEVEVDDVLFEDLLLLVAEVAVVADELVDRLELDSELVLVELVEFDEEELDEIASSISAVAPSPEAILAHAPSG